MKYLKYLALIIGFNLSCRLFKQSTKTINENKEHHHKTTSTKIVKESAANKQEQRLNFYRGAVKDDYAIRFWPKSDLAFTSGKGFSGQFDSILMTGKYVQDSQTASIENASGQQNDKTNYDKEEKLSFNASRKNVIKKSFNDYLPIFLSLVFIVFGLFWGCRRVRMSLK